MSLNRPRSGSARWLVIGLSGILLFACGVPPEDNAGDEPATEGSSDEPMSIPSGDGEGRSSALSYPVGSPGGSWIRTCDPKTTFFFSRKGVAWFCALCLDRSGHVPYRGDEPAVYCIHADNCPKWCAWNNDGRLTCGNC